jgi:predicted nucleic acid-binding protein
MILVDLNVILDVVQKREPHYGASAAHLDLVAGGSIKAMISAHCFTTIHYIIERYQGPEPANRTVDWLLVNFQVGQVGKAELSHARLQNWNDFEDAVTAAVAEAAGCHYIVTRDLSGFLKSKTRFLSPEEYLAMVRAN